MVLNEQPDSDDRETYSRSEVVSVYEELSELFPDEYEALRSSVRDCDSVLDVGVGAGRTSYFLADRKTYVGIDFSPAMIDACRKRFPTGSFEVGDARNLRFKDDSFDVVVFSFNGIDGFDYRVRQLILNEFRRVLRSGGILIFSRHNPFFVAHWHGIRGPRSALSFARRVALGLKRSFRSLEWFKGHGRYVDPIHGGILIHSARPRLVSEELMEAGFTPVAQFPKTRWGVFDIPWFYYVAKSHP